MKVSRKSLYLFIQCLCNKLRHWSLSPTHHSFVIGVVSASTCLCFIGVMSGTQSDSALAGACNITLDSPRSLRQPNLVISFPYFSSSATWAFGQLINWKYCSGKMQRRYTVFIGPESDHWLCLSVTNSLTDSLPFSKLDWCDPGMWRCQLKTCWGCYCCWCWCLEKCWQWLGADLEAEVWL